MGDARPVHRATPMRRLPAKEPIGRQIAYRPIKGRSTSPTKGVTRDGASRSGPIRDEKEGERNCQHAVGE